MGTVIKMSENCEYFVSYIKSLKGAVRLLCVVLNFCAGVSMAASWPSKESSRGQFFSFTAWSGFIFSIISLVVHSFNVFNRPDIRHWPWHQVETAYSMVWAFFYLVGSSCVAAWANDFTVSIFHNDQAWTSAAIFGFLSCVVYLILTWWSWNLWRHGSDGVDSAPSVYETGISYQNSAEVDQSAYRYPYPGHRPGTDPSYPAPHQVNTRVVPMVTVTTPA